MPNVSFKIPLNHVNLLDELVREGFYKNRAQAIREGILLLVNEMLFSEEEDEKDNNNKFIQKILWIHCL